ncbi:parasitic phase-specific protein PSP-1 [Coccidioides immitis H538.4]|uniref:Parasitic phase-specific protein PSP-1 n=1 Tax=Coccidioides immitis H538.4 TaxID=396776 RepID=A0A0J8RLG4_COCIT|nr:parasitic phase-specific protein PSP-1 [Coccidioides immitis H538.4]
MEAGIYFTLSRIVTTFGADNSRIRPLWYPRIFIPCDIIALSLQGAGGGIASSSEDPDGADLGKNIMIAGLVAQVVTLSAFILLAVDFSIRAYPTHAQHGRRCGAGPAPHSSARVLWVPRIPRGAGGVDADYLHALSEGWDGPLMRDEPLFIVLEGVMIVIAVVVLNAFNPAICFKDGYDNDVSQGMKSGKLEAEMENETETETETDSLNPVERSEDFETRYMDDVRLDRV